jgi:hypothetical protein
VVRALRSPESKTFKALTFFALGDLGTTAKEVEGTLERNFELANRWGCILLLDEADVFLAKRTTLDFVRNGLVAGQIHQKASKKYYIN